MSLVLGHSVQRSRVGHSGFLYGSNTDGEQTVPGRQTRSKIWRKPASSICKDVWEIPKVLSKVILKKNP